MVFEDARHMLTPEDIAKYGRYGVFLRQRGNEDYSRLYLFQVGGVYVKRMDVSHPYANHYTYGLTGKFPM